MSDEVSLLRAVWMSDPSVSGDDVMSAVDRVLHKDRVARTSERQVRVGGVIAVVLLMPALIWSAAYGVTPLVRGAYALMAVGCGAIIAAEWAYLEWSRRALPGPADARSQLQKTAFMLARQIWLMKTAPLWSSPVFIGMALIAVWLYREQTHAAGFALFAVAVVAWITAGLRTSSTCAKLNDQRLQLERLLNELQSHDGA
jgi:hypothetical protein